MDFAHDKGEIAAQTRVRVRGKLRRFWATAASQGEDVEPGEKDGIEDVGRREEHRGVGRKGSPINERSPQSDQAEEEVARRKRIQEIESHPCCRSQQERDEVFRVDDALNHGLAGVAEL